MPPHVVLDAYSWPVLLWTRFVVALDVLKDSAKECAQLLTLICACLSLARGLMSSGTRALRVPGCQLLIP
eukprot:1161234-Pelagomonas_calceolata.AAC.6